MGAGCEAPAAAGRVRRDGRSAGAACARDGLGVDQRIFAADEAAGDYGGRRRCRGCLSRHAGVRTPDADGLRAGGDLGRNEPGAGHTRAAADCAAAELHEGAGDCTGLGQGTNSSSVSLATILRGAKFPGSRLRGELWAVILPLHLVHGFTQAPQTFSDDAPATHRNHLPGSNRPSGVFERRFPVWRHGCARAANDNRADPCARDRDALYSRPRAGAGGDHADHSRRDAGGAGQ